MNGETPIDCVQCSVGFFKAEPGNYGCSPCPFGANEVNANTTNAINGSESDLTALWVLYCFIFVPSKISNIEQFYYYQVS